MYLIKSKPTLYSVIKPKDPWGGSFTFTKHFLRYLKSRGWKITFNPRSHYDVAYSTGWFLTGDQLRRVCASAPLLFRMDGLPSLYRNESSADTREQEKMMELQARAASHVVFQSQYCRESCVGWNIENFSVILNGTDMEVFFPDPRRRCDPDRLVFLSSSWSSNTNKGMPLFKQLAVALPQHEFRFMGNWPSDLEPGPVAVYRAREQKHLAAFLRQGDVFVHLALCDPCPNVVIEAIASGLFPVVSASGGGRELIGSRGYIWKGLGRFMEDFPRRIVPEMSLPGENRSDLSLENVGSKYLEILDRIKT